MKAIGITSRVGVCLAVSVFAVCVFTQEVFAQEQGAVRIQAGEIFDHADVMWPSDSFRYWLDTVNTDDEAFKELLKAELGDKAPESWSESELRRERERRVEASFDFDAFIASSASADGSLSREQMSRRREELMRMFLSGHAREKYAARNIKDIVVTEYPDFDAQRAYILLTIADLVSGEDVRYRVNMKLYPGGLMWRWYKSELYVGEIPKKAERPADDKPTHQELTEKYDAEIDKLNTKISALKERQDDVAAEVANLTELQEKLRAERAELERQNNPYGTPESAFRTAYGALSMGNWEKFLSSHSARVRENAGDAARDRFTSTVQKEEVQGFNVLETTVDPEMPDQALLKIKLRVRVLKDTGEGSDELEPRVVTLKLVWENGLWLLDEDI